VGTIVAIDGPAGAGKSTVARRLAQRLGYAHLDTGAMYRAVTWAALRRHVDLRDPAALGRLAAECRIEFAERDGRLRLLLDGQDVSAEIRGSEVTANARHVADSPAVKAEMARRQRRLAATLGDLVTEGRDQGTAVFPDAAVKIYLTAAADERARRRVADLRAAGEAADASDVQAAIERRDAEDEARPVGPLRKAADAIEVDTTDLSIEQVVDKLAEIVRRQDSRLAAARAGRRSAASQRRRRRPAE
jgi:cytidylate kinase